MTMPDHGSIPPDRWRSQSNAAVARDAIWDPDEGRAATEITEWYDRAFGMGAVGPRRTANEAWNDKDAASTGSEEQDPKDRTK